MFLFYSSKSYSCFFFFQVLKHRMFSNLKSHPLAGWTLVLGQSVRGRGPAPVLTDETRVGQQTVCIVLLQTA